MLQATPLIVTVGCTSSAVYSRIREGACNKRFIRLQVDAREHGWAGYWANGCALNEFNSGQCDDRESEQLYEMKFLRDLVHEVVQLVNKCLNVDWPKPYREDVKAAVKRVLRARGVKPEHFDAFFEAIMDQAIALYGNWPQAA